MVMIIAVGRMKAGAENDLVQRYLDRCKTTGSGLGFPAPHIVEIKEASHRDAARRKAVEAEQILGRVPAAACLFALDEKGKAWTSQDFAGTLQRAREHALAPVFVIGGPDGLDKTVRHRADHVLSFGAMTLPHQLVRVLIAEQLYRAMTILSGHPYHRQ